LLQPHGGAGTFDGIFLTGILAVLLAAIFSGKGDTGQDFIIPPDFSRKAALKSKPEVGLFLDNTDSISSAAISSAVSGADFLDLFGVDSKLMTETILMQISFTSFLKLILVVLCYSEHSLTVGKSEQRGCHDAGVID